MCPIGECNVIVSFTGVAVQDGADSQAGALQQAVVSAKNVITNGARGGDATITTTGGPQVRCA